MRPDSAGTIVVIRIDPVSTVLDTIFELLIDTGKVSHGEFSYSVEDNVMKCTVGKDKWFISDFPAGVDPDSVTATYNSRTGILCLHDPRVPTYCF